MSHTILRTGTYTPQEGDDGEFRTQRYPDGSAVIVHEGGITFVRRRAPYFVSIPCVPKQVPSRPDQDVVDQVLPKATFLRLVPPVSKTEASLALTFPLITPTN